MTETPMEQKTVIVTYLDNGAYAVLRNARTGSLVRVFDPNTGYRRMESTPTAQGGYAVTRERIETIAERYDFTIARFESKLRGRKSGKTLVARTVATPSEGRVGAYVKGQVVAGNGVVIWTGQDRHERDTEKALMDAVSEALSR